MTQMIAFEFPDVKHPDLEIEWQTYSLAGKMYRDHEVVWMRGCKTCQNCLSECGCGDKRVESKVKLYVRGEKYGDQGLTQNFFRFFRATKRPDGRDVWTRITKESQ